MTSSSLDRVSIFIPEYSGVGLDVLQCRQEQIDVDRVLHLLEKQANVFQKLFRAVVKEDVHVHALGPAGCKGSRVILLLNQAPDASQDHGSRVDGLEVAARHLQHQAHLGRDGGNEPSTSLNAAAPLIFLRIIRRDIELCAGQHRTPQGPRKRHMRTFFWSQVDKLDEVIAGGEDEVLIRHDKRCAILC